MPAHRMHAPTDPWAAGGTRPQFKREGGKKKKKKKRKKKNGQIRIPHVKGQEGH